MPDTTLQLNGDVITLQCRHIKPDGRRCGSPSLHGGNFCYHHNLMRRTGPRQPQVNTARAAKANTFSLPTPADLSERTGLQLAVAQILHKIANNEIDPRRAGLLLYGLQIASTVLPKTAVAEPATIDTSLVHEVIDDTDLGPLAPEAEWTRPEARTVSHSILEQWLQKLENEAPDQPAADPSLEATQARGRSHRNRTCRASRKIARALAAARATATQAGEPVSDHASSQAHGD